MKTSYETGLEGERLARVFLENKGFVFLESRYRTKAGEIDLIMRDGSVIVFIEVKFRPNSDPGSGLNYINNKKQQRIAKAAVIYLYTHALNHSFARFDVIQISRNGIYHILNAYYPGLPV